MKYVLVSGGVISGIGKGVIASSTGLLLKTIGHGEVFVLDDGGEVDLDLGNYERYLNITLTRENNITTGKVYQHVIERERRGDYLGKTVQVVPHLTDAIQDWIERVARIPVDDTKETPDVCIIELGGTVGDIESAPFIEAMRQLKRRAGKGNFLQIHVSLVPVIQGEQKTKPTQQAIRDVGRAGLVPDLIACRCDVPLEKSTVEKIAMFCQVESEQVIGVHNVKSTYHVPLLLEQQGLISTLKKILNLDEIPMAKALVEKGQRTWTEWKFLTTQQERSFEDVSIVLVGKYTKLHDSYLSVIKSLEHSAMRCGKKLNLIWVEAEHLEDDAKPTEFHKAWHEVCTADGILVPGGFGDRGTEGMIAAAKWARTNKTPYLGICLEFQPGSEWSRLRRLYGEKTEVHERHRHRYEVNPEYVDRLHSGGLEFVGKDDKGERMEIVEIKDHPWYVGVQFHPEYLSRVLAPSKSYLGFVAAAAGCLDKITEDCVKAELANSVNGSLTNGVNGVTI
ncbi:hypothetical protein SS1G_09708 [Sclerotinia sclerotiorum 1980 UF-70]|uniref:CTP synthase n=1 Tax=Sclerotinia sclerotiorum (strain ATCC 18683 / 1980 / Ss-1) TaxID=665079 RepID=A7EWJ9_SCLS1|nr:hypothetical protein SS1G_09708 [Sclerotinia sclerotiorum 1980 UF-70]EDN93841.1 hypothetical protein SS1G_09708 [Sclerotinia sclerotiorum 1980 UF-70]